jgi:outer membrane protein
MKYIYALLFLLTISTGYTQQPQFLKSFSLQDAVQFAIKNNYDARNAALGETQAKWRNKEIIATGLPKIDAGLDYSYYYKLPIFPAADKIFNDTSSASSKVFSYLAQTNPAISQLLYNAAVGSKNSSISFVLPHTTTASVQLTQLIFDGRYVVGLKATKDFTKSAMLQRDLSEFDIKYNVTKAYYQTQASVDAQVSLGEIAKTLEKILNDTRKIYEEGLIEELDVNRLELALANLQNQIATQKQMGDVSLANLKFQMGLPLTDDILLTENLTDLYTRTALANASKTFDASNRIEYDLLQTVIRIQGHDLAQRKSGYMPTLAGFVNFGFSSQVEKFGDMFKKRYVSYPDGDVVAKSNWFQQGIVGLSLKVPIFDGFSRMSSVKQAEVEVSKARNNLDKFKQAAILQLQSSQAFFNQAVSEEFYSKKGVVLSEKIYNTSNVKFKEGIGSSFELTQAQQDLIQNKLKYIQAQLNVLTSKADLDKALGIR